MLNDYMSSEQAKERIKQLIQEAETERLFNTLDHTSNTAGKWVLLFVIIVAAMIFFV